MHSSRPQSQSWSNFATAFPQGDAANHHRPLSPRNIPQNGPSLHHTAHQPSPDDALSAHLPLDGDQRNSAALLGPEERSQRVSYSPLPLSPIPASVTQPNDISSSPAAMFLSAFMACKPEPEPLPDDEGQVIAGYTLGKVVGFGGFSTIRKAFSETGGVVAVKIVRRGDLVRTGHAPEERKRLQHEAAIWSSLSHEHILPLFSVVHTDYADYFITPYCPAGSLYDILKRDGQPALPQDDAGMMFRQVVRGLRYLHEVALLVHRDMKLENVLVDESGTCRIGDFGLSVLIGDVEDDEAHLVDQHEYPDEGTYAGLHRTMSLTMPSKRFGRGGLGGALSRHNSTRNRNSPASSHVFQPGSLPYAAPELLLPHAFEMNAANPGQDIWALGVMLYTMLTGRLPFHDSFEPRLQMKILNGTFDVPEELGRGAERILHGCMERNLAKRWTIAMVDDVAWGVGWGSAGDVATPEESPEDDVEEHGSVLMSAPPCLSSVDLRIPEDDEDDWQKEEHVPRSAIQAASRRSTSRAKRSLSRAPLAARNPSTHASARRSRPGSPTRNNSMYSSYSSRNHSPCDSPVYDTHPGRSRSQSRHRGRRPTKANQLASRSPSPSVVPSTPIDLDHRLASLNLRDPSEVLDLNSPPRGRGRARFCLHTETFDEDAETEEEAQKADDLPLNSADQSVERTFADWPSGDNDSSDGSATCRTTSRHAPSWSTDSSSYFRKMRPGSNPPPAVTTKSWELYRNKAGMLSRNGSQDFFVGFGAGSNGGSNPISRSRSVDLSPDPTPRPGTLTVEIPASS